MVLDGVHNPPVAALPAILERELNASLTGSS